MDVEQCRSADGHRTGGPKVVRTAQVTKIIRRVDRRLILTTGFLYALTLIDQASLRTAAIASMRVDLGFDVGVRYLLATLIFFVAYIVFQPLATILCRKSSAKAFIAEIMVTGGIVLATFAFLKSWMVLVGLRFLLGLVHAGFLSSCLFLISTWYTRFDLQKRLTVFYMIGYFLSGFGGLLAYGALRLDSLYGIGGWPWVFILEGIITIVVGLIAVFILIDFPDQVLSKGKFLAREECEQIIAVIDADRGDAMPEPWSFKLWISSGKDFFVWGYGVMFFCSTVATFSISPFMTNVLRGGMARMELTEGKVQGLLIAPYAVACVWMYVTAWLSDKYRIRGPVIAFNTLIGLVGLCAMAFVGSNSIAYFGVFLTSCGFHTNIPACMTYQSNNIRGQWKRAFSSATLVAFGGLGSIVGTITYQTRFSPLYLPGIFTSIGSGVLALVIVGFNTWCFRRENAKADRGEKILQGHPGFRYTI